MLSEVLDATGHDRDEVVRIAAEALRRGELVVLPTDTVYGLAADAFSAEGTRAVFAAKQRGRNLPLPVLVRSPKQVNGLVTAVPEVVERIMAAYWPGPLTIVVRADPNLSWDLGDTDGTVAIRMPLDELCLDVIRAVGPLAVTSANLSGQPPATDVATAQRGLGESVAVYLDDGPRRTVRPSTIVDLTRTEPAILREGAVPESEVLAVATGELGPQDVAPIARADVATDDLDDAEPA
ncbi:MAG: threonylcarbamoyl-AMP synthase [Actinobacteria bacterium]|nr:threonylcarbamoyl-AMP synthase [Actinomycetota bacterium]